MALKGYCTIDEVAGFLARTFTPAQEAQCEALIESAESHIDGETGRGWLVGVQTDEAVYVDSQNVWLRYAPVASVATVTVRSGLGESDVALTVDVDYEVSDLEMGRIRLVYPGNYDRVLVDYTPVDTVPADLRQACIDIVAAWMQPTLMNGMYGLDSYSLPDLTVKFSRAHVQQPVPPLARAIIDRYRYPVTA